LKPWGVADGQPAELAGAGGRYLYLVQGDARLGDFRAVRLDAVLYDAVDIAQDNKENHRHRDNDDRDDAAADD